MVDSKGFQNNLHESFSSLYNWGSTSGRSGQTLTSGRRPVVPASSRGATASNETKYLLSDNLR